MKRGLALALVFSLLFATGSLAATKEAAYDMFVKAGETLTAQLESADSMSIKTDISMALDANGGTFTQNLTGTIEAVMSDAANPQMKMILTSTDTQGESIEMYFKDGFAYLELMGMKIKTAMPMEDFLESSNLTDIDPSAYYKELEDITSYSVKDLTGGKKEITFALDSSVIDMNELPMDDIAGYMEIPASEIEITASEFTMTAVLSAENELESMDILLSAGLNLQGTPGNVDYNVGLEFIQLGGVVIDFPADLDTYMAIETE